MEPETISKGWDIGLTVYELLAPVLAAALSWVSLKLSQLIRAKTKNEMLAGMLARLNESTFDAVKFVNQNMKDLIGRARDPASRGGKKITTDEADELKSAALEYVKSYWGTKGILELGKVLGFGNDSEALETMISNKIEAAVNDVKTEAKVANPE